jgi:beta-glucosidase
MLEPQLRSSRARLEIRVAASETGGPGTWQRSFPADFVWAAATSAYQIEGAVDEDGRGESIWDRFSATPGKVANGETGRRACDSYHRYGEDIRLMRELGLNGYRFSISWPRIVPEGRGRPNAAGLDYYERFVDELLANGIEPFVTLYHWDLPQALEDRGGWPARATVDAFAEYVEFVVARMGDRVTHWITQCEPWVISWLGYGSGEHAPGRTSEADALATAHHVLLAHGRAAEVLRRESPRAKVGITIDLVAFQPLTDSTADAEAVAQSHAYRNRSILDPVLRGEYPQELLERFADIFPRVEEGDMRTVATPLDFLGVNYYTRNVVRADPQGGVPLTVPVEGAEHTEMGWEVYPDGLFELLVRLRDDYALPPLYVTENGAAFADRLLDGKVEDLQRASYVERHLSAIARAIDAGVNVRGYFLWSLLDNFEWAWGYSRRFGIIHVDFETLERVPKASYRWYRDFIAAQRQAGEGTQD